MPDGEFMWDGDLAGKQRGEMLVELILPRDWYDDPDATFPSLYGLNGLYGSDYSSAWLQENRGDNLKWETFLTEELPGLLARDWRTNNHRGAMGVSMGATASVLLAQRHPHLFQFAGSMSGFLDTSSPGMPEALDYMFDPYSLDAQNMWGPYYSSGWFNNDPKLMLGNLRNSTVFVSSGTGNPYPGEGLRRPGDRPDQPGGRGDVAVELADLHRPGGNRRGEDAHEHATAGVAQLDVLEEGHGGRLAGDRRGAERRPVGSRRVALERGGRNVCAVRSTSSGS